MKKLLTIMLAFILCFSVIGQNDSTALKDNENWCGAHTHLEKMKLTDTGLTSSLLLLDGIDTEFEIEARKITIPVVVHVIWNDSVQIISPEDIKLQIQGLSLDFNADNWDIENVDKEFKKIVSDTKVSFKLATIDPNGESTNGITYTETDEFLFWMDDDIKYNELGGHDAWDTEQYLNVWIGPLGSVRGYAQFPGGESSSDGVVVDYGDIGLFTIAEDKKGNTQPIISRVLTHEVGHWLGLYHIWGDDYCGDDGIKDTPTQAGPHWRCSDSDVTYETCESIDLENNYMDYIGFECMVMFTKEQRKKMWKTLVLFRKNLLTKANHKLIK